MPASYPGSVKNFTTKVDGVDDVQAAHVNDLQLEVAAVETDLLSYWVDRSGSSTVTGWAAGVQKEIKTLKIGKWVLVQFFINGTSNDSVARFTLPYVCSGISRTGGPITALDAGAPVGGAVVLMGHMATLVECYKDLNGTGWTSTGYKTIYGQFWYYTDTA